jgi:hypothetical protein
LVDIGLDGVVAPLEHQLQDSTALLFLNVALHKRLDFLIKFDDLLGSFSFREFEYVLNGGEMF